MIFVVVLDYLMVFVFVSVDLFGLFFKRDFHSLMISIDVPPIKDITPIDK
jgi:hypothetical protein